MKSSSRILNNIDLNQIDDPEVIALYRSILDEIGMVEISDRERTVITEGFRRGVQRKMGTDLFVMGAQAATGQVGSVIQTAPQAGGTIATTNSDEIRISGRSRRLSFSP